MTEPTREDKLSRAFVTLASTLVADFDLVDLLQTLVETCVDVLDVQAAGLLLKTDTRSLQVVASTTEDAEFVELVQVGADSGPCLECVSTGVPVVVADIDTVGGKWPDFQEAALQRGFRSLQATPLRLRRQTIGAMGLFDTRVGALNEHDAAAAQALADVATIGILAGRGASEPDLVARQLHSALDSRIIIEQAKGILAQTAGLQMDAAFKSLRSYARTHNLTLPGVATALVQRRLDALELAAAPTNTRGARASHPTSGGAASDV